MEGCGSSSHHYYWSIESTGDFVPTLEHLRYGEVPPRFRAEVPAPALRPGCYEAFTQEGGGEVFFEVSAAGDSVKELDRPPKSDVGPRPNP